MIRKRMKLVITKHKQMIKHKMIRKRTKLMVKKQMIRKRGKWKLSRKKKNTIESNNRRKCRQHTI